MAESRRRGLSFGAVDELPEREREAGTTLVMEIALPTASEVQEATGGEVLEATDAAAALVVAAWALCSAPAAAPFAGETGPELLRLRGDGRSGGADVKDPLRGSGSMAGDHTPFFFYISLT